MSESKNQAYAICTSHSTMSGFYFKAEIGADIKCFQVCINSSVNYV